MERLKNTIKKGGRVIRNQDAFGKPVTVNYKGADTFNSICGGLMTIAITVVILIQFQLGVKRMINRDNPEQASFFIPTSRGPEDSLNVPELGGQVYIALVNRTEYRDGSVLDSIIPFEDAYINGKYDTYAGGLLEQRKNLPSCGDENDFYAKANYTSGLDNTDFSMLKCIPADQFSLYNLPAENFANSIGVLFEQCGGKYSQEKDKPADYNVTAVQQGIVDIESILPGQDFANIPGFGGDAGSGGIPDISGTGSNGFPDTSGLLAGFGNGRRLSTTEWLLTGKWPRHRVALPLYDTSSFTLPASWNRLIDGRIVTDTTVFYSNGTNFEKTDSRARLSSYPNPETVEGLGATKVCDLEGQQLWLACGYTERADGVIESPAGFKLYPNGLLTTKDDLVFLDQLKWKLDSDTDFKEKVFFEGDNTIGAYIGGQFDIPKDSSPSVKPEICEFDPDDPSCLDVVADPVPVVDIPATIFVQQEPDTYPQGFSKDSRGFLQAPDGFMVSPDGWVASQDGIVLLKYRATFKEFIERFSSIDIFLAFSSDLKRPWPRQQATPKLGSYSPSNLFKAQWQLSLPDNWTLLPDGRVVISTHTIWYPNGIVEFFDFKQERFSFEDFHRYIFPENPIPLIPSVFEQDAEKFSITSPQGWIFYKNSGLIVTPTGDLIFGKNQAFFLDLFRKSKDCKTTQFYPDQTSTQYELWVNLENGVQWIYDRTTSRGEVEGDTIAYGREVESRAPVSIALNYTYGMPNVNTAACNSFAAVTQVQASNPSEWPRHKVKLPYYDTSSIVLPENFVRTKDGRLISDGEVFYSNGTYFDFGREGGLQRVDASIEYPYSLEQFIERKGTKTSVEFSSLDTALFKYYKSINRMTTLDGLVFPKQINEINSAILSYQNQLISITPTLVNSEPDSVPGGFVQRADGSLLAPNGLIVSKDGWLATSDGFVLDDTKKYDFATLISSYSEILENVKVNCDPEAVGCDYQKTEIIRTWPRPIETAQLGNFSLTEDFKQRWLMIIPQTWTALPDGRVFLEDGSIWFPNGVLENPLTLQTQVSFAGLMKLIYAPQDSILPSGWTWSYNEGSITSPLGWNYYPKTKTVLTPEGDIWYADRGFDQLSDFIGFFKVLENNQKGNYIYSYLDERDPIIQYIDFKKGSILWVPTFGNSFKGDRTWFFNGIVYDRDEGITEKEWREKYIYKEVLNVSKSPVYAAKSKVYDTASVRLPHSWKLLDDGRIITENNVFYSDGTVFNYSAKFGIDFDSPTTQTLDEFISKTKLIEGVVDLPADWTQKSNGVIEAPGYIWYPSGVITTSDNLVLPFKKTAALFIDWVAEQKTISVDESTGALDSGFTLLSDGSLRQDFLNLVIRKDGWVATSDGFTANKVKSDYRDFVSLYKDIGNRRQLADTISIHDNKRTWPAEFDTKLLNVDSNEAKQFYQDWILNFPKEWTLLPDGRVISPEELVWFPNGVMEDFSLKQQQKFADFDTFFTSGIIKLTKIPADFITDVAKLAVTSPQGWTYYPEQELTLTPKGEVWFERQTITSFLQPFNLSQDGGKTSELVVEGQKLVIDLRDGALWKPLDESSQGSGISFKNGVFTTLGTGSLDDFLGQLPTNYPGEEPKPTVQPTTTTPVTQSNGCKDEEAIRKYMENKIIRVYVAQSYVNQEDQEPNENELITFLTPIVEKQLDFRLSKSVNTVIQEVQMEIQDSYWQIFRPDKQELEWTATSVYNEDSITREYITLDEETKTPRYSNNKQPMLKVNFQLDTTITVQERQVYDSLTLFGDIGGLSEFIFVIVTPIIGLIVSNRYEFSLFSSLFWVNDSTDEQDRRRTWQQTDNISGRDQTLMESQRMDRFKLTPLQVIEQNPIIRLLTCRPFRRPTKLDKIIKTGSERVDRQLDVRSLIMTQNMLLTLTQLLVKQKPKRQLMRIQHKHKVIEPCATSDDSEDLHEIDLAVTHKKERPIYSDMLRDLEQADFDMERLTQPMDDQMRELMLGTLRRGGRKKKVKHGPDIEAQMLDAGVTPVTNQQELDSDSFTGNQQKIAPQNVYKTGEQDQSSINLVESSSSQNLIPQEDAFGVTVNGDSEVVKKKSKRTRQRPFAEIATMIKTDGAKPPEPDIDFEMPPTPDNYADAPQDQQDSTIKEALALLGKEEQE